MTSASLASLPGRTSQLIGDVRACYCHRRLLHVPAMCQICWQRDLISVKPDSALVSEEVHDLQGLDCSLRAIVAVTARDSQPQNFVAFPPTLDRATVLTYLVSRTTHEIPVWKCRFYIKQRALPHVVPV